MRAKGSARCQLIQGDLWYDCDFEQDQYLLDGTLLLKWQLHWTTGWDPKAGEYRAASADNNGPTLAIYRGTLNGTRLVYEPIDETLPRIGLTWELTEPGRCIWRNEYTLDSKTWTLIEQYDMTVAE